MQSFIKTQTPLILSRQSAAMAFSKMFPSTHVTNVIISLTAGETCKKMASV